MTRTRAEIDVTPDLGPMVNVPATGAGFSSITKVSDFSVRLSSEPKSTCMPIGTTGCSWTAPNFITTLSLKDASRWEQMKAPLPMMTKTAVAALGDDAFYTVLGSKTGDSAFATLTVKKGGTAYMFKVYSRLRGVPEQMSIEKALATNVLAAL